MQAGPAAAATRQLAAAAAAPSPRPLLAFLLQVQGTVVRVDQRGAYVDIGGKSTAFCPTAELALANIPKVRCGAALSPALAGAAPPARRLVAVSARKTCRSLQLPFTAKNNHRMTCSGGSGWSSSPPSPRVSFSSRTNPPACLPAVAATPSCPPCRPPRLWAPTPAATLL